LNVEGGWPIRPALQNRQPRPVRVREVHFAPAKRAFNLEAPHIQLSQIGMAGDFTAAPLALAADCGCGEVTIPFGRVEAECGCSGNSARPDSPLVSSKPGVTPALFATEFFTSGKRLLLMFLGFAFIGYFLNGLIPASWVAAVFGSGNIYKCPARRHVGVAAVHQL
jgi:hypothetical protein